MTSFSDRHGFTQPKQIQINDLDIETRNSLWNVCSDFWFTPRSGTLISDNMYSVARSLYKDFYKVPVNALPSGTFSFVEAQLGTFQTAPWYHVLNLVEFLHAQFQNEASQQRFRNEINGVLEREKSGYRFIAGRLAHITADIEMWELEQAAKHIDRFAPVTAHVMSALDLYSKKPNPDYRNSIKESISAVEAAAKIITGQPTATLDGAIRIIEHKHSMHGAFRKGITQLYGYTSDEGGIRHSLTEATDIDEADALYMLVSRSAFANYLIRRYAEQL
ncbi:MAG: hypothetical protein ABSD11_21650 [Methylocella sp.]|jgi:hypothetical protein